MLTAWRRAFERLLEAVVIFLLALLAAIVLLGVGFRTAGAALSWYDEVASILLAWLTYYGAALAALKRAHIGFPGLIRSLPPAQRKAAVVVAETLVFAFFILLAWVGWVVLEVIEGDRLVSLPEMPQQVAQSVIPIGAVLFVIAEALSLPSVWREASGAAEPPALPPSIDGVAATE